jgi:NAD(P)-dependent dehydrogenase (short-subunit alcohol dehydrogenase family)
MSELQGRVALVTGAGHGIGAAYARGLAELGATVVLADIDDEAVADVARKLATAGLDATAQHLDVTDADACAATIDALVAGHGSLDIVVNNAAVYRDRDFALAEDISVEMWRRMLDVNVSGAYYTCRAAIPHMKQRGWGRIVNQSSTSAYAATPRSLHYSMTKAALITMTKTLAKELGPHGITVNAIAPGVIDTDATRRVVPADVLETAVGMTALRRIGRPDDLTPVLAFLCSSGAGYITGQTIVVDGGVAMPA